MGDPAGLMAAVQCRLSELGLVNWIDPAHPLAQTYPLEWERAVVHAGADVGDGAFLCDSVLLPGAQVVAGERVFRQIRAKGMIWQL
jgi:hypothetical protein